ncbi:hypothetical protein MACK_002027 [Theileria orientalis]|uniref:Threonylcarbamoyl-AMP synthase n=1 Tax=Theileria orientalis TaxID=68886 RepID=A0A976MBH8_THEOR|nr:hypothetical protein MACK_002027 [Theileria orientalis]
MKPVILEICHDLESSNRIYDSYKKVHQRELEDGNNRAVEGTSYSSRGHTSKYEREYGSTDEIFLKIKNVLTRPGGLVAIPTETVYGLAGNIYIEQSLKRIFEIKNRPFNDPLIVHVDSFMTALEDLYDVNMFEAFIMLYLANRFTPGPLTMVAKCNSNVSGLLTNNTGFLATRCPDNEVCRALLRYLNIPLAAPSANKFGHISPTCAEHVYDEFSNEELHILDGGQCKIGIESTVIKITTIEEPEILCKERAYDYSSSRQYLVKNVYKHCREAIVDLYGELNKIIVNYRGRMTSKDLFGPKVNMDMLTAMDLYRYSVVKGGLDKEPIYSLEGGYSREDRLQKEDRHHKDRTHKRHPRFIQEFSYSNGFRYSEHERYVRERLYEKERRHFPQFLLPLEGSYGREELYSRESMHDHEGLSLQELISGTEDRYRQKLSYNRDGDLNKYCGVSQEGGSTSFYKRSPMASNSGHPNSSVTVGFTQSGGSTCVYDGGYTVNTILNPYNRGSADASRRNSTTGSGHTTDSASKNCDKSKHKKSFSYGDLMSHKGLKISGFSRTVVRYKNGKIGLYDLLEKYRDVTFKVEILRKGAVTYEHLQDALSGFNNVQVCEYERKPEKESEKDTSKEKEKEEKKVPEDALEDKDLLERLEKYKLWQKKLEDMCNENVTFVSLRSVISSLRKLDTPKAMSSVNTVAGEVGSDHDDDYVSVNDFDDRISVDHFGSNDDDYMSIDDVDSITGVIDNISGSFQKEDKGDPNPNGIADGVANRDGKNGSVNGATLSGENGTITAGSTADTVANGTFDGKDSYRGTDGDRASTPGATSAENSVPADAPRNLNTYITNLINRAHDQNDPGKDKDIIIADSSGKDKLCSDGLGKVSVDDLDNEDSGKVDSISGEVGLRFEAPGMSMTHYAPNVPTYLVVVTKDDRTLNGRSGYESRGNKDCTEHIGLSNGNDNSTGLKKVDCRNIVMIDIGYRFKSHSYMFKEYLPVINEPTSVANQLYSVLRRAESAAQPSANDHSDAQAIIAIYFNERKIQLYSAIHDRITRSTSGNPIYAQINDQELEFSVK